MNFIDSLYVDVQLPDNQVPLLGGQEIRREIRILRFVKMCFHKIFARGYDYVTQEEQNV